MMRLRELAEAGVDAVDDIARLDDLAHRRLRGQEARARRRIERELHAAGMHAAQRGQVDIAGREHDGRGAGE